MYLRKHASSSLSLSLVLMHAIVDERLQRVTTEYGILREYFETVGKSQYIYIYIPLIIADNRLRRRYRSAKMEILVSKFDAAFKGFAGSFKRLLWAEITPRPVRLFAVNDKNRRGESFITRATFEEY